MNLFGFERKRSQITILHVDDSRFIRMPVSLFLRQAFNCRILEADDGLEGLEKAIAEHPDLIILDVLMPGMDGLETLLKLRENPKTRDIPVLMCTAKNKGDEVDAAFRFGATGYIVKPIEEGVMIRKVQDLLVAAGKLPKPASGSRAPVEEPVIPVVEPTPPPEAVSSELKRPCRSCRGPLTFIEKYTAWYCYTCLKYPDLE